MGRWNRITVDPAKVNGQPCIRGMRLTVRRVLEAMATFPDRKELLDEYPELEEEDIRQVLLYAAERLGRGCRGVRSSKATAGRKQENRK